MSQRKLVPAGRALALAGLLGGLALAAPPAPGAPAQPAAPGSGPRPDGACAPRKMLEDINLTPAQKDKFKEHFRAQRDRMRALRDERRAARAALDSALAKYPLDQVRLDQAFARIADVQKKALDLRADNLKFLAANLGQDQFRQFLDKRKACAERFRDGHGRRHGSGGPGPKGPEGKGEFGMQPYGEDQGPEGP